MATAVLEPPAKFRPVDPLGGMAPAFPEPASGPEREPGQELDGIEDEKRNHNEGCGRTDDRQGVAGDQSDPPGFSPPVPAPGRLRQHPQPPRPPHYPPAQERDAQLPHGLPEDAIRVDTANAAGWHLD